MIVTQIHYLVLVYLILLVAESTPMLDSTLAFLTYTRDLCLAHFLYLARRKKNICLLFLCP
jgi:hypothetical protein